MYVQIYILHVYLSLNWVPRFGDEKDYTVDDFSYKRIYMEQIHESL